MEVRPHSVHLSELADMALVALTDPAGLQDKEEELTDLFSSASQSYGATTLPVAAHVQKLVESATKK